MNKEDGGSGPQTGGAQTPSNVSKNWGQGAMDWQRQYGQGSDPYSSLTNYPQQQRSTAQNSDFADIQKFLDSYLTKIGMKDETVRPLGTKINY